MTDNSLWKEILAAGVLVIFTAVGVGHVFYPDRFIKPYVLRRYGLSASRLVTRLLGGIFAGGAIYILYDFFLRE